MMLSKLATKTTRGGMTRFQRALVLVIFAIIRCTTAFMQLMPLTRPDHFFLDR